MAVVRVGYTPRRKSGPRPEAPFLWQDRAADHLRQVRVPPVCAVRLVRRVCPIQAS